jgi:hypothetical protein
MGGFEEMLMNGNSRLAFVFLFAAALTGATSTARAATLALDFQPTGGTTAPGFQAFEATNQTIPVAGTNYAAFGSTVTVSLATANLPDGNLDFRAVARNGTANSLTNDWIGVDTRAAGMNVTLTVNFAGLPAGLYSWLSTHHDGAPTTAPATSNGNLSGMPDYSFTDASGVRTGILNLSSQLDNDPVSTFATTFRSNGVAPVSFSMIMDNGQGDVPANALFAFINGVQITNIPEPASLVLIGVGLIGLAFTRRR